MGLGSFVMRCNLVSNDVDGLKKWLKKDAHRDYAKLISIRANGKVYPRWDSCKIVSYWRPDFLSFLIEFAKFVQGTIHLVLEDESEYAIIIFNKGKCVIELWNVFYKIEAKDFLKYRKEGDRINVDAK